MLDFQNWKRQKLRDPQFKEEYDKLQPEMAVIRALIEARLKSGLTQKQLAEKIGTKQSVISRLESGRANPTIGFLYQLARGMDAEMEIRFNLN